MCACTTSQTRADYEKELVSKLVRQFPPATHPELTLMSVAQEISLQDWILLNEIAQQGYKKVYLQLVDPETSKARVEQFTEMAKALAASKNIEIQIELAPNLKAVAPGKKFDCIHAIGFKLTYMPYSELWRRDWIILPNQGLSTPLLSTRNLRTAANPDNGMSGVISSSNRLYLL